MAELTDLRALSPCAGLLPLTIGDVTITEVEPGTIAALLPFRGQASALSDVLKDVHGMALPDPNRSTGREGARCVWSGMKQALLIGPVPDARLADHAAVVDQSDAWAVVRVEGADAVDVLARLVPIDLRQASFKRGHAARTMLGHMTCGILRVSDTALQIMVFRSMAATLVHELEAAARMVAARRQL